MWCQGAEDGVAHAKVQCSVNRRNGNDPVPVT